MGTDMPDFLDAVNPTYGDQEHGAATLHDDVAGYQAAHVEASGDDGHTTVVGHSYGSYVAGQAAEMGMRVDDMVFIGSPGVGTLNVDGLGMPSQHVWAGAATGPWVVGDGDPISDSRWFGPSPTDDDFGATVFDTSDSSGHSEYYKENSQSLRNIGRIATGHYDGPGGVERRPPD
jgi:pimeloyl-ACP methyl ester carboxylesterase